MFKKKIVIIIAICLIVAIGILFMPRSLKNRLPEESIETVIYIDETDNENTILPQNKYNDFNDKLKNIYYIPNYPIFNKGVDSTQYIKITYESGKYATISQLRYKVYDEKGKVIKGGHIDIISKNYNKLINLF